MKLRKPFPGATSSKKDKKKRSMIEKPAQGLLIVDDEPENLDLLERTFRFNYSVYRARDGEEALYILKKHHDIAVIITDQRMPGLSGTEFLQQARELRSDAVRIILTGYTNPEDLIEAINSINVYKYMTKPWDVEEIVSVVERAMRLFIAGGGDMVDESTGLPNRGMLRWELRREIARADRMKTRLAVIKIELVDFDEYVKIAGRKSGEELLMSIGHEIKKRSRAMDIVGIRERGVFVVLVVECTELDTVVNRLRHTVTALQAYAEAAERHPSLKIELESFEYSAESRDELIKAALGPME